MYHKLIIYLLILILFLYNTKPVIEKLTFNDRDFLELYPKYNLGINLANTKLIYQNKYKINYQDLNSEECNKIVNNKNLTSTFLEKYNIPIPKSIEYKFSLSNLFSKKEIINNIQKKLNYPLVVKPVGECQSKDVYINIKEKDTLRKILQKLTFKYKELKIEEHTEGKLFRILIINNEIIDILERPLPFVIGNGKNTIDKLINIRNENQINKGLYATKKINYQYIKNQTIDINKPILKNKKIYITNIPSFFNGSNPIRINIKTVHQDNLDLFLKINSLVKANISGLDFISNDLGMSYQINSGKLIEINDSFSSYQIHKYAEPKKNITPQILANIEKILQNKYKYK
jgi:D-alanine-D-alanine ligase-like ATP-grasp enzyme